MKKMFSVLTVLGLIAAVCGAGGSSKSGSQGEFDINSSHVSYAGDHFISEGKPFDVLCTLTLFDQLKWTKNGSPIDVQREGYTVTEIPAPRGFIGSKLSAAKSEKTHTGDYKCTTFSPLSHSVYILSAHESVVKDCEASSSDSVSGRAGICSQHKIVKWYGAETDLTKLLRVGYPMALECKIVHDADVQMKLKWFKDDAAIDSDDDRYKVFHENSTLLILKAARDDVGQYRCQTVGFTPPKTANISIVFLTFKSMTKSMTVLQGDKFSLTCDAEGDPSPIITWQKDGVNVEDSVNDTRFSTEANPKGTLNGVFNIDVADYEDRAEYTCVINILDVRYTTSTYVRVKDMYAALWPFLGICAEVLVLCIIIFIYEKRRAKADFEESDTDQPSEQKTPESNRDSLRCRK